MTKTNWEDVTTSISRGELADIIGKEMDIVLKASYFVGGKELHGVIKDLLLEYSSRIAAEIFKDAADDEDEEEIR